MSIHSISLKGRRNNNEDSHTIIPNGKGQDKSLKNIDFFAIYDGHGGAEVSEYVEKVLPQYFLHKKVPYPLSKHYVTNVYDHVQQSLQNQAYAHHAGSTGLVMIMFKKKNARYINVINNGDSRCVLCKDNFAYPLTKDHKPHWPEERTRIEQTGGKITFDGMDYRITHKGSSLSVSRSFGDFDTVPFITHRADVYRYALEDKDKFIVMACDGLWDVLSNHDVVNFILTNCYDGTLKHRINPNINIAEKLAEYALIKNSGDNITIIVIFL